MLEISKSFIKESIDGEYRSNLLAITDLKTSYTIVFKDFLNAKKYFNYALFAKEYGDGLKIPLSLIEDYEIVKEGETSVKELGY